VKIKYLEMSAFGPFKDVEAIDFEAINKKQIFLISGPTGAGKTTIFDAISFALYGKASGANRSDPENMRSDFASIETRTYVKLVFTVHDKTYEIIRYPKQERPSKRKTDLITMPHQAKLFSISNPTDVLTRVGDVNDRVLEILGISFDQFRQIVMLPQGEFQALLLASSDERTKIFRRIFDTDFFERFQERLKDQADAMKKTFTDDQTRLESYYGQIVQTDQDKELKRILASEYVHVEAVLEELGSINRILGVSLQQKRSEERVIQETIEKKKERIRVVEHNNDRLDQKQEANQRRQELESEKTTIDAFRKKIDRYERALQIRPLQERVLEIEENTDRYVKRAQKTKDVLFELKEKVVELKKDYDRIPAIEGIVETDKAKQDRLDQTIERLKSYLEKKQDVQAYEEKVKAEQDVLQQEQAELEKDEEKIKDLNVTIRNHEDLVSKAIELMQDIQAKEKRIHADELLFDLYIGLEQQDEVLKQEKVRFEREHHIFIEKEKAFRKQTRRYLSGQATLLAESLEEGEPCPVCGSIHHPNKAEATDETISHQEHEANKRIYEEELAKYRQTESRIERLKEKREDTYEKLQQTLREQGYASSMDKPEIAEALTMQKDELQAAYRKQKEIDAAKEDLKRLRQEQNDCEKRKALISKRKTEAQRTIDRLSGEMNRITYDLVRLKRELGDEKRELDELKKTRDALEQARKQNMERIASIRESYRTNEQKLRHEQSVLVEIEKDIAESEAKHEKAKRVYQNELDAHFSSAEELDRTLEMEHDIDTMKKRVKSHDEELLQNRKWLEVIEKEIIDQEKHDTHLMKKDLNDYEEKRALLQEDIRQLDIRYSRNLELENMIAKTYRSSEKARKAYEKAQIVADIARGMRGNKISFERYVLAYFFNEILVVANRRLANMTSERYTLFRKSERMKGSGKQGLDLIIHDAYTSKTRDVSTLSGGESFKAALALALGLAEIVERNAGGISLETMFIDEGFGTLDQESLDMAIETLLSQNKVGRVVGIISHVQELKDRIETKITLDVTNEGSKIR
jgi:DNA repair protein SbcC/Rad50